MKIIAHRGNLNGANPDKENTIESIYKCIKYGFDVEIDIRVIENTIYLGHDSAKQIIKDDTLEKLADHLWIHCKNITALDYFRMSYANGLYNYFWHEKDTYTLTSKGFIWSYPGSKLSINSINVMPEWFTLKENFKTLIADKVFGVCTDYPILLSDFSI